MKYISIINKCLLFCFFFACVKKEDKPERLLKKSFQSYPFIRYEHNYLHKASYISDFFGKLDNLIKKKNSKVKILHIGDSHIQAGFLSGQLRQNLQSSVLLGNGGRGFFFPHALAQGGNSPINMNISYRGVWCGTKNIQNKIETTLGLAGVSAHTYDEKAGIRISSKDQHSFKKIRLFSSVLNENFLPFFQSGTDTIFPKKTDKIYYEFEFPKVMTEAYLQFKKEKEEQRLFRLNGIELISADPGIVYEAVGVNGAKTESFLKCKQLNEELEVLQPDLIIISLGTNDAYTLYFDEKIFYKNYDDLLAKINASRLYNIILTSPGDCVIKNYGPNPNMEKVRTCIFDLAKKYHAAVWDFYSVMGERNAILEWAEHDLAQEDKVHFTEKGYALQAELFFNALLGAYYAYLF